MADYSKQVDLKHYSFSGYFYPGRWMSYWYQANEILNNRQIRSVLDVGPGTDFLKSIITIHNPSIIYHSVDIAEDLKPDFIGSVTALPFKDNEYDAVCAFQVLEHIRFEDFETAIKELKRVSSEYVLISLPHYGPSFELLFKLPFVKRKKFSFKLSLFPKHEFGGEHYWEIGKKGYSLKKIKNVISKHLDIIEDYIPFENQYHHFFVTKKPLEINQK